MNESSILLVDDNPNDEQLTLRALRKNNILNRIVIARDGAEALNYLSADSADREANELPQVVLLDLNLPKIGGLEVLRRIRAEERTRPLPVVILTSSNEDQDLLAGYTFGANSYVVKRIEFHQFADAVKQVGPVLDDS
jgi:two-component system response regulator